VAEETKTPVAIRVTRPYGSDEEFLQHEIDTLTRTTVMLLGAQSRPQGVILRFEITLATGTPLLRGEGRVVAFRQASQGVDAGLTLRFTRLDARSKALVDRAASLREARARSVHPPRLEGEATPSPPQSSRPRAVPEAAPTAPAFPAPPPSSGRPPSSARARRSSTPAPAASVPSRRAPSSLRAPPARRREELLDRLRQRAKKLTKEEVDALLASRRKRAASDSPR
jgi:molecular chaperone DnaK